jgi:cell wall-associated NlpC family hydrolase
MDEPACHPAVERAIAAGLRLKGTPYLWGGRTSAGVDCSGLVQTAFGTAGIRLPRDSDQQACVGRLTATRWSRAGLRRGDALFFLRADGRVGHTAIYLGDDQYLEAVRPAVQITSFNPQHPNYSAARDAAFAFAKRWID